MFMFKFMFKIKNFSNKILYLITIDMILNDLELIR